MGYTISCVFPAHITRCSEPCDAGFTVLRHWVVLAPGATKNQGKVALDDPHLSMCAWWWYIQLLYFLHIHIACAETCMFMNIRKQTTYITQLHRAPINNNKWCRMCVCTSIHLVRTYNYVLQMKVPKSVLCTGLDNSYTYTLHRCG